MVNLILHDPPNAGFKNGTRKNSQTLLQEIKAGIASGTLTIQLSDGTTVTPQSLRQTCPNCPGQPSATTAGIVVGCLVAGCVLGILLFIAVVGIYKCMKRSGKNSNLSYSVQKDDM